MKRNSPGARRFLAYGFLFLSVFLAAFFAAATANAAQHAAQTSSAARPPAGIHPSVIYGDDNRKDIYDTDNTLFRTLAESTVALFNRVDVIEDGSRKTAKLVTENFGDAFRLCADEPFRDQPSGAFCSGSLVGDDLVMTAGHCVRGSSACSSVRFVFGFAIRQQGVMPEEVPIEDVFSCQQVVAREELSNGADYAVIRLDRPVRKYRPLEINRSGDPAPGAPLVVIGHPSGLPTKVSDGARVRDASPDGYFVANLDTYGGNSGSAVINTETGLAEGILVRGEQDFTWRGSCQVSNRCPDDGCRGEDVTKVSSLARYIPPGR